MISLTCIQIFKSYGWKQNPDLVVSLVALYNKVVWENLQIVNPCFYYPIAHYRDALPLDNWYFKAD
ncbi:MAG: hypothetical protein AAF208_08740 [Cyanobacteria bacterium P01_A01_bin.45]